MLAIAPKLDPLSTGTCAGLGQVETLALFVLIEPIDGIASFQARYAVTDAERRRGPVSKIVQAGLEELRYGMGRSGMPASYVETIVGSTIKRLTRLPPKVYKLCRLPCLPRLRTSLRFSTSA